MEDVKTSADPEHLEMYIPQPKAAEIYYDVCGAIDRHKRCRQDDLMLERKLGTVDWSMRVNTTTFAICVVDSWLAYKGCKGTQSAMTQSWFYLVFSEQLIDNTIDRINLRRRTPMPDESQAMTGGVPRSDVALHLTPT